MKKVLLLGVVLAVGLSYSTASAMLIDFTDADTWSGVSGTNPYTATVDSMDVTLSASIVPIGPTNYTMSFNGGSDAPGAINAPNVSLQGEGDGIGIKLIGDTDEINANSRYLEKLTVSFAESMLIQEIYLLDLFYVSGTSFEKAVYSINGIETTFDSITAQSNTSLYGNKGFQTISLGAGIVSNSISFWVAPPGPGEDGDNDYALAGIAATVVPEPCSVFLFLSGLIGIAGFSRRK